MPLIEASYKLQQKVLFHSFHHQSMDLLVLAPHPAVDLDGVVFVQDAVVFGFEEDLTFQLSTVPAGTYFPLSSSCGGSTGF